MKKLLYLVLVLIALVLAVPVGLLLTGTIDTTSLKMALNVMTGGGGPPASEQVVKSLQASLYRHFWARLNEKKSLETIIFQVQKSGKAAI